MVFGRRVRVLASALLAATLILDGSGAALAQTATATAVPTATATAVPTATAAPPTSTAAATATAAPPTSTAAASATAIPPSATAIPPTATPIPPTATGAPPTATATPVPAPTLTATPPALTPTPIATAVPSVTATVTPTTTTTPTPSSSATLTPTASSSPVVTPHALTSLVWTGSGLDNSWTNPLNWDGVNVPDGTVIASIQTGSPAITLTADAVVGGLILGDGASSAPSLTLSGHVLTIGSGGATVNAGATLRAQADGGNAATVSLSSTLTNSGTIQLTQVNCCGGAVTIDATAGSLVNASAGSITVDAGAAGGARVLSGAVTNNGLITANQPLSISSGAQTFTNNGSVSAPAAATITLSGTFVPSSGSFSGSGAVLLSNVTIGSGALTGSPTFTMENAQTGAAATVTNNALLVAEGGFTNAINGSFTNAPSGSLVVQADNGNSATLTINNGLTNNGAISLTQVNCCAGAASLAIAGGTLTNAGTGVINANTGNGGTRQISGALLNQATINVNQPLTLASATFTNSSPGTVNVAADLTISGGTFAPSTGVFNGLANIHLSTTFSGAGTLTGPSPGSGPVFFLETSTLPAGASLSNNGVLVVPGLASNVISGPLTNNVGATLRIQADGGNAATLATSSTLTNNGLIQLTQANCCAGIATLDTTAGSLVNASGGTISSDPGVAGGGRVLAGAVTNNGAITVNQALTISNSGVQSFTNGGGVNVLGAQSLTLSGNFVPSTGFFSGSGTVLLSNVTIGSGSISGSTVFMMENAQTAPGATVTNGAMLVVPPGFVNSINGAFTNALGGTIAVQADNGSTSTLTINNGLTNNGIITLTQINCCGGLASLVVAGGTLTNSGSGVISSDAGANGGSRQVSGTVLNLASINVNTPLTLAGASFTNTFPGTVNVAADLTISGGTFAPDTGTFSGAAIVHLQTTFSGNGGLSGPSPGVSPTFSLEGSTLPAGASLANNGILLVPPGSNTIAGPLSNKPGASLLIQANNGNAATLATTSTLANDGAILLTQVNCCGGTSTIDVSAGMLINGSTGSIVADPGGTGGGRVLNGQVSNNGSITVNTGLTISNGGAVAFTNAGLVSVPTGQTLTLIGSFVPGSGSFTGAGTVALSNATVGSGSLSGTPTFVMQAAQTAPGSTVTNNALLVAPAGFNNFISGSFVNGPGGTLSVQADGGNFAMLGVKNGLTNNGVINLTQVNCCAGDDTLTVDGGTLANFGTINSLPGAAGGNRLIIAVISPTGTINQTQPLTIELPSSLGPSGAGPYGGSAVLTATLTSGGSPLPGKTVSFSLNGSPAGSALSDANGLASLGAVSLSGLNAGIYAGAVTASFAGDASIPATSAMGDLIVTPAPLVAAAANASRPYGGVDPAFTGSLTGVVNGDPLTASFSTSTGPTSMVGTYPIVPTINDPSGRLPNYTLTTSGMLTITPLPVDIVVNDASRPYGAPDPAFSGVVSGLINGDKPAVGFTSTATSSSPVGAYSIQPAPNLSDPAWLNYTQGVITPGTLTVTQAASSLTAPAAAAATSDSSVAVSATVGLVGPAALAVSEGTVTFSLFAAGAAPLASPFLLLPAPSPSGAAPLAAATSPVVQGGAQANLPLAGLQPGSYDLKAAYSGSGNITGSAAVTTFSLTVAIPTATATATATATPTPTPTATTAASGNPPSSPSSQTAANVPASVASTLAAAGIQVTIPDVPASGTLAQPAEVPVPLAPLAQGALVLPASTQLTTQVITSLLTASAPVPVSAAINVANGGAILAGNVAVLFSPQALAGIQAQIQATTAQQVANGVQPQNGSQPAVVRVDVSTNPPINTPGGNAQFSPNGTILDIKISDQTTGQPITTFAAPVNLTLKYNSSDLGQANGDPTVLTAGYVIDELSPAIENPLHFPIGTLVIYPPENARLDTASGTINVATQAIGSTIAVVTNPVGYVQTLSPDTSEQSSFDAGTSQSFGTKPQFSYLQVVEPQVGDRLLVLDPDTGNYAYVNATDVGPAGPPPAKASAAVVRGLLEGKLERLLDDPFSNPPPRD